MKKEFEQAIERMRDEKLKDVATLLYHNQQGIARSEIMKRLKLDSDDMHSKFVNLKRTYFFEWQRDRVNGEYIYKLTNIPEQVVRVCGKQRIKDLVLGGENNVTRIVNNCFITRQLALQYMCEWAKEDSSVVYKCKDNYIAYIPRRVYAV